VILSLLSKVSPSSWGSSRNSRLGNLAPLPVLFESIPPGGATDTNNNNNNHKNDDDNHEERYSRQVYTLGARAHGRVRSTTVYVDGPSQSGLLFECVKNLALSGVSRIVIVGSNQEELDARYHNQQLDDLGNTYSRAARTEIGLADDDDSTTSEAVLVEFLHRLNPSLQITNISRSDLAHQDKELAIILCIDRPFETQVWLNTVARDRGFPFVAVETAGVYGRTFCDFGSTFVIHDIDGETPLVVPLDHVEIVDRENSVFLVHCVDGERHDVSKGDKIQFLLPNDNDFLRSTSCSVKNVQTPRRFLAVLQSEDHDIDTFVAKVNAQAPSLSRVKTPVTVSFKSLKEATAGAEQGDASIFTACDLSKSFDSIRRDAVFGCFQALPMFLKKEKRLPTVDDFDAFMEYTRYSSPALEEASADTSEWHEHVRIFTRICAAKFTPIQCIFGAIAAQETLKAATGLYNPISQFLLYDCDEILDSSSEYVPPIKDDSSPLTGQAYIIGQQVQDDLQSRQLFVVGAGAIGCEILKNLAAMGASTALNGRIIVTDNDTIERSNLSRQLLFRDGDIGKFKSMAAKEAVYRLNPNCQLEAHTSKVGGSNERPFDDRFWSKKLDVVLNALDNVEARLYMDQQCVANEKAMVDAGTLGSKGNVQVVVPHQSESYGSSADPPEPAIPVCTLKNFPYLISHTIQWGRDLFDGLFHRRPKQCNDLIELLSSMDAAEIASKVLQDQGDEAAMNIAQELAQDLAMPYNADLSRVREAAIDWAVHLAKENFYDSVENLLRKHPVDSFDEDGEKFWSGSRKVPKSLLFSASAEVGSQQDVINQQIVDFVKTAARLRIETFVSDSEDVGYSGVSQGEAIAALTRKTKSSSFKTGDALDEDTYTRLCNTLVDAPARSNNALVLAEFEKDDESNGHVAFIAAASNLRALCYGIPPVDALETRRVAGRIVPAMITTTAFVSALSCIELIKLIKGVPLSRHRNAFINLALPFFAFTAPLPAEKMPGLRGKAYTIWDRISIKDGKKYAASGGITLRRFLKRLKAKACDHPEEVDICTVAYGEFMIYANFLHQDDDEIMDKNIWELVEDAISSGQEFDNEFSRDGARDSGDSFVNLKQSRFLDLTVLMEDLETGEEVELPPIRVLKFSNES
jgi:ubiquitin-activating enzyme E1